MAKQRDRQRARQHARHAAAARARRRKARRRWMIGGGTALALLVAALVVVALAADDDGEDVSAGTTTTTTAQAAGSAAGKPCVEVSEDVPAGAPEVPVKVGAPPKELLTEDLKVGDGAAVEATHTVTVNYIGVSCSTGAIFDSSYERNQPATFQLNQVIPGWQQGLRGMKVGGRRLLGIPPGLAYGEQGQGPEIAPDETLWFVVEVVETKPGP